MKLAATTSDIVASDGIIRATQVAVDNARGMYGKDLHVTLYVHSNEALTRIMGLEGYRSLPFSAMVVVDPKRVPNPVGVSLEYRRGIA